MGQLTSYPSLNDRGEIAFTTFEKPRHSLVVASSTGLTRLISSGDIAPGTGGQTFSSFLSFSSPLINNSGTIAFTAAIWPNPQGTDGIFLFDGKSVEKIVVKASVTLARGLEPDEAPGTGGQKFTALYGEFSSGSLSLNNLGSVAFVAGTDGQAANGIFIAVPQLHKCRRI